MENIKDNFLKLGKMLLCILALLPILIIFLSCLILLLLQDNFWGYKLGIVITAMFVSIVLVFKCKDIFNFIKRNSLILTLFNIFDIIIFFWIGIDGLHEISVDTILLWLFLSIIRTCIIRLYFYKNKIEKISGKTYLLNFCMMFFVSVFQILFYVLRILYNSNWLGYILLYSIIASIGYVFVNEIFKNIDRGPESFKIVLLKIFSFVSLAIFIIVLHLWKSEFINTLTWFLPIFIPVFIGEINSQFILSENTNIPEPTPKMKKHLYWLQMFSFNTLLLLNFSLTDLIDKKSIKEILTEWLTQNSNSVNSSSFLSTCIILVSTVFISLIFSSILIWVLKTIYLDKTSGYFDYKS